ncbi:MAG: hypothetical protein D6780_00540, partial [Candidatus Dadabacteria bacterium]
MREKKKAVSVRKTKRRKAEKFPVLVTTELVVFPGVLVSLHLDLPKDVLAVSTAIDQGAQLFCIASKKSSKNEKYDKKSFYNLGTLCSVIR